MFFDITHKEKNTRARTGVIHTDHGDIETPVFMPVGTQATVKSIDSRDIDEIGSQIILANTYHLHLRPGEDLIASFGGLHKFMAWDRPILTDSGGFQVFSLASKKPSQKQPVASLPLEGRAGEGSRGMTTDMSSSDQGKLVKIDNDGVTFQSYIDGSTHRFTPETAIDIQHKLGADIIMAFDECTPDTATIEYTKEAMDRTHRWAKRCLDYHKNIKTSAPDIMSSAKHKNSYRQFLFGIIQGANHKELREESAKAIGALDFDGIAVGGESVGYNMDATKNILDWVIPLIPEHKPHYAMGLGLSPLDLFDVVERGIDMVDCVAPTRVARNGTLYVHKNIASNYRINITNAKFRDDAGSIDPTCPCATCRTYSRAYIHHLFAAEELLAYRLATIHNLFFFLTLMKNMRAAIAEDKFLELKQEWLTYA